MRPPASCRIALALLAVAVEPRVFAVVDPPGENDRWRTAEAAGFSI